MHSPNFFNWFFFRHQFSGKSPILPSLHCNLIFLMGFAIKTGNRFLSKGQKHAFVDSYEVLLRFSILYPPPECIYCVDIPEGQKNAFIISFWFLTQHLDSLLPGFEVAVHVTSICYMFWNPTVFSLRKMNLAQSMIRDFDWWIVALEVLKCIDICLEILFTAIKPSDVGKNWTCRE